MIAQVATAPPGTQVATLDIESAFRNIPVLPAHKAYLVVQCRKGDFYIDHVVPFGIASGVGLQGRVMDGLVDVLDALEMGPNRKWVDDLWNMRYPVEEPRPGVYLYGHDVQDIYELAGIMRVPWSAEKCRPHDAVGTYFGFLWDLPRKRASLPPEKRERYLSKLASFLAEAKEGRARVTWKAAMSLNGTLSHICFIYPQGRAFLTSLCGFIASFGDRVRRFAPRFPPPSLIRDLEWWRKALENPGIYRDLVPRGPLRDLDMWVDASTDWGIGLVVGERCAAWKWAVPTSEWKTNGRDIGWAEMIAVELATRYLDQIGTENSDILVRGDNMGVVGAFERGRSRNYQVNESIRRTEVVCMSRNIRITLQYVNTKENRADEVSRGAPSPRLLPLNIAFSLPPELSPFLVSHA